MANLREVRGCKCTSLWRLVMYFCVHTCTSPSNDYTAVACSNKNQAQLHSSLLISRRLSRPRVTSRYSGRISTYFKQLTSYDNNCVRHECIYVTGSGHGNSSIFEPKSATVLYATVQANWCRKLYLNSIEQPPTTTRLCTVAKLVLCWTLTECLP